MAVNVAEGTIPWSGFHRHRALCPGGSVADGRYTLRKADHGKDQTYALYNLTQEQLARTLMPLGKYTKVQVRAIAESIGLPVANKPDSQEICFVEDRDYAGFLTKYTGREAEPGHFVDTKGHVLGNHRGIIHYTIGQRKGLGIAMGRPMFVVEIRPETREVVLGEDQDCFFPWPVGRRLQLDAAFGPCGWADG